MWNQTVLIELNVLYLQGKSSKWSNSSSTCLLEICLLRNTHSEFTDRFSLSQQTTSWCSDGTGSDLGSETESQGLLQWTRAAGRVARFNLCNCWKWVKGGKRKRDEDPPRRSCFSSGPWWGCWEVMVIFFTPSNWDTADILQMTQLTESVFLCSGSSLNV